jgi:hypothetical protein
LQARLVERWPTNAEARDEEIRSWHNLAVLHESLGRTDERENDLRQLLRLTGARADAFPAVSQYSLDAVTARANLAAHLDAAGRADDARRVREEKRLPTAARVEPGKR